MPTPYAPLRAHTEYTLPDGAIRIADYVAHLKASGAVGGAITDRGVLYGAHEFAEAATEAGLVPILGLDLDVVRGEEHERIVLLARTEEGFRNLSELSRLGFARGEPGDGHAVSADELSAHSAGLVALVGGPESWLGQALLAEDRVAMNAAVDAYRADFASAFLFELRASTDARQQKLNEYLETLARNVETRTVATPDAWFLAADDHAAQQTKAAMMRNQLAGDESVPTASADQYVWTGDALAEAFGEAPVARTAKLAEAVPFRMSRDHYHVPSFPLPDGVESEKAFLRRRVGKGAIERYGDPLPDEVKERIRYELDTIGDLAGYFLIVSEIVDWARSQDIPVGPGRGSAAGSIVAYTLGITDLCPIEHDLLFERFLNPDRVTMPDIDIDFDPEGVDRIREHLRDRYGEEAVSQIISFGRLKARAVFRRVAKAHGMDAKPIDALASSIDREWSLDEAIEQSGKLAAFAATEEGARLLDLMRRLEGQASHETTHASGVVVAPGPVHDFVPVCPPRHERGAGSQSDRLTQFDMTSVESLGLLKIDLLGIKSLGMLKEALKTIRDRHGLRYEFRGNEIRWTDENDHTETLAMDEDEATFDLLRSGRTTGLFQIEQGWVAEVLQRMEVDSFKDLTAALALIRPGARKLEEDFVARKKGDAEIEYVHPDLEPILEDTYGVFLYQEQIIRAAKELAGFSPGEADLFRKAVGKKDEALIAEQLEAFKERAVARGYPQAAMDQVASEIAEFGRYGFNRSHSAVYAQLAYISAFLKAHYPAEFLAARANIEGQTGAVATYLADARREGVRIVRPDVNESQAGCSVAHHDGSPVIRFGLANLKGIGSTLSSAIIGERREGGPFTSYMDFVSRMQPHGLNRLQVETLADAGALDEWGHRAQLAEAAGDALDFVRDGGRAGGDIFDEIAARQGIETAPEGVELPQVPPYDDGTRLEREKELAGLPISLPPSQNFDRMASDLGLDSVAELDPTSGRTALIGRVFNLSRRSTNGGDPMASFELDDGTAVVRCVAFGKAAESDTLHEGASIYLQGSTGEYKGDLNVKAHMVAEPRADIHLSVGVGDDAVLHAIGRTLREHPGASRVYVHREGKSERQAETTVACTDSLLDDLDQILGADSIKLTAPRKRRPEPASRTRS